MRCLPLFPAVPILALALAATDARAITVIVPDGAASIQTAIDSNADTIVVKSGYYPEPLRADHGFVLMNAPAPDGYGSEAFPEVGSFDIIARDYDARSWNFLVRGIHFRGAVRVGAASFRYDRIAFEECRMDSGFHHLSPRDLLVNMISVRGCTILGGAELGSYSSEFSLNAVIGGGVLVYTEGYHYIDGNVIEGPAAFGIRTGGESVEITGNRISGTDLGIDVTRSSYPVVAHGNRVTNCGGDAFRAHWARCDFARNTIENCAGDGFAITIRSGHVSLRGNSIRGVGGAGIRVNEEPEHDPFAEVDSNVVGRCGGAGIVFDFPGPVRWNTVYSNAGSGLVIARALGIEGNLVDGNGGYGIEWTGVTTAPLTCNNWFGNQSGVALGTSPGSSDSQVDAMFCDLAGDDVHLRPDSPVANVPDCGGIGALGVRCGPQILADVGEARRAGGRALPLAAAVATVIVPDDYPTIQQAIDSGAATILVKRGSYAEDLQIHRGLTLTTASTGESPWNSTDYVEVRSLRVGAVDAAGDRSLMIRGIRFLGRVTLPSGWVSRYDRVAFEICRMDSGLVRDGLQEAIRMLSVRGCTFLGDVALRTEAGSFTLNAVLGGATDISSDGYHKIRGNVLRGQATFGLRTASAGPIEIRANVVSGTGTGMTITSPDGADLEENRVEDCSGDGFDVNGSATLTANECRRVSGTGFNFVLYNASALLQRNSVEAAGVDGIHVDQSGDHAPVSLVANTVGRCGGHGILVARGEIRSNTTYLNGGSGIVAGGTSTIDRNISYGNRSHGFEWLGSEPPTLACNDWFFNQAGSVAGTDAGPTDLSVDPRFCDVAAGDVHLDSRSPLLDYPGCGLIGALGQGCLDETTPTLLTRFEAVRAGEFVRIEWTLASDAVTGITVQRAPAEIGPWSDLSAEPEHGPEGWSVLDREAESGRAHFYRLRISMASGTIVSESIALSLDSAPGVLDLSLLGENPSHGPVRIEFSLPQASTVRLAIYDIQGRQLARLADGPRAAGRNEATWNAVTLTGTRAGVYFVRLITPRLTLVRRLVLTP